MNRVLKILLALIIGIWLISPIPEITLIASYLVAKFGFGGLTALNLGLTFAVLLVIGLLAKRLGLNRYLLGKLSEILGINLESYDSLGKLREELF